MFKKIVALVVILGALTVTAHEGHDDAPGSESPSLRSQHSHLSRIL